MVEKKGKKWYNSKVILLNLKKMTKKTKMLLGILAAVVVIAGAGLFSAQSGLFKGMIFSKNKLVTTQEMTASQNANIKTPFPCKSGTVIYNSTGEWSGFYNKFDELVGSVKNGNLQNCDIKISMDTGEDNVIIIPGSNLKIGPSGDGDSYIWSQTIDSNATIRSNLFANGEVSFHGVFSKAKFTSKGERYVLSVK